MKTIPFDAPTRQEIPESSLCKSCAWLAPYHYAHHCKAYKQIRELNPDNRYVTLECGGYERLED